MEHHISPWIFAAYSLVTAILLLSFAAAVARQRQRVPVGFWQNAGEQIVESFRFMAGNILGPAGEKHFAFLGTVFLFILISNMSGLIPVIGKSSTANLNTTVAVALVVFVYVQIVGIRENGLLGYLKHFTAGTPPAMWVLMVPLEIIGELAKPVSLSFRLYGNMYGDEMVVGTLAMLAVSVLPIWLPVPFQFPMMLFGLFAGFVQALVFTTLTAIYISLVSRHDEH